MLKAVFTSLTLCLLSFTTPASNDSVSFADPVAAADPTTPKKAAGLTMAEKQLAFDAHVQDVYSQMELANKGLAFEVFQKAFVGFQNLRQRQLAASANSILTIVDFTLSSSKKRLWIVDLDSKKVLFNTLVAHGRNTGQDKALKFSNQPNSYMSSVGFYLTGQTYYGKHGLSLRLSGMDEKYNSNAMSRAIVMHGADYVSDAFIKQNGRLGRSLGCPAIPREVSKEVIEKIKNKTVFYIHGADHSYTSAFLNPATAVEAFFPEAGSLAANL